MSGEDILVTPATSSAIGEVAGGGYPSSPVSGEEIIIIQTTSSVTGEEVCGSRLSSLESGECSSAIGEED